MSKYLDINKIYKAEDSGQPFSHVILDDRQGIPQNNGFHLMAEPSVRVNNLSPSDFANILDACKEGDQYLALETNEGDKLAFKSYAGALTFIPEPFGSWNATAWILSRMGECHFRLNSFKNSVQIYNDLMWMPGALGNPWIHLRKGQIDFENGDLPRAGNEFTRAYMGGGKAIFAKEDAKYYEYLKSIAVGLD